ncbi:TetR family transcriptional regulator [Leucobacter chromiiresistens]|uniref:TetR family transcriptional regulator n=2 Tax=Leucobacter chromiiresistens TaxID=1079994 RepID=A0A147ENN0_9MICO|nr:TetR family transcriptional regulator [Leucobacter chromiiresistens]
MRRAVTGEGYEPLTIERLAADAGVSKQTIYRWWPNKAAILGEALVEGAPPAHLPLPHDTGDTAPDLAADLLAWLAESTRQLQRAEGLGVARALIAVTAADPEIGAALNERLAAPIREWVQRRIDRAAARGELRDGVDAILIADHLIAITAYAALTGTVHSEERLRGIVAHLMHGIVAPPE